MSDLYPALPKKPHLTPRELAQYLGISVRAVYERISAEELPHLRIGKIIRISREDAVRWCASLRRPQD